MRDLNEQMNASHNSRAKFKQRVAGGAVLLIVLAIFLPFIFNHSHMNATTPIVDDNPPAAQTVTPAPQTQAPPPPANSTAATTPVATGAGSITPPAATSAPVAQVNQQDQAATAPAAQVAQPDAMRSNQPGLTSPQSESAAPVVQPSAPQSAAPQSAPQQPAAPSLNSSQSQPVAPTTELAAPSPTQPVQTVEQIPKPTAAKAKPAAEHHAISTPGRKAVVKTAAPKTTPHLNWIVQVGSFTQVANAQELAVKLRTRGLQAYMQREPNHMVHVYVGPLANQQEAQKIQKQIKAEFQLSSLVTKKHV